MDFTFVLELLLSFFLLYLLILGLGSYSLSCLQKYLFSAILLKMQKKQHAKM